MTAQVKLWAIQPGNVDKAELVERAMRLCYRSEMSETREAQTKFLAARFREGHTSPAEHARWVRIENGNPYRRYWAHRYGMNITSSAPGTFTVSRNARNEFECSGVNPVLEPELYIDELLLNYGALTERERLAHASATFEVSGISRACSHQLVRHRVMSFSQESQRYCDSGEWEPVVPPTIPEEKGALRFFKACMNIAKSDYRDLRDWGIPKQDARFILPNATPTRLMVTATFEHWRHFLALRLDKAAQWEIRGVARQIHAALMEVEPGLFVDLGE